jgi:hypothetical protein
MKKQNVCGGGICNSDKKHGVRKTDTISAKNVSNTQELVGPSNYNQKDTIYSQHIRQAAMYKTVRIHSAYLGEVNLDVYDVGNGYVALQSIVRGLPGHSDIFVKEIDARINRLTPGKLQYGIQQLAGLQPTLINIEQAAHHASIIKKLVAKKTYIELHGGKLKPSDQNQLHRSYIHNNAVDIHFNTCHYLDFLHKHIGKNNVINSNILLSIHNVHTLDNAYWTGDYMVYGNGDTMFYPLGSSDIGGHEAGHGLVQTTAGLKYRGHSGALNESFADVFGVSFEFFLYNKFNSNSDGNTSDDINGGSDWFIGEDGGKRIEYLRNMEDPTNAEFPQPKTYKGIHWADPNNEDNDFGGVHINSGVGNYTFYLLTTCVGWEKALGVFWACLQQLGPDSNYIDFRNYLKAVCVGDTSLENGVKMALEGAGLTDDAVTDWVV